jgi:tRNA threonylcarbamoyladenosine modification (KEOPS) complex  Pcc1 subunit
MLRADITVEKDVRDIERLFASEEKEFDNKRASYKIKKGKDGLVFSVSAKDSSALRAALNSITKMLIVYEKTKGVVKGEDDE